MRPFLSGFWENGMDGTDMRAAKTDRQYRFSCAV
jgi:hypothetical protein